MKKVKNKAKKNGAIRRYEFLKLEIQSEKQRKKTFGEIQKKKTKKKQSKKGMKILRKMHKDKRENSISLKIHFDQRWVLGDYWSVLHSVLLHTLFYAVAQTFILAFREFQKCSFSILLNRLFDGDYAKWYLMANAKCVCLKISQN